MNNLIKLTVLTFSLLVGIKSMAQNIEIKTGLNLSTMNFKNSGETYSYDSKLAPRFLLGITKGFPISESFSVESGLLFSSKGYKIDTYYLVPTYSREYLPIYESATLNYIDIPISLKLTTSIKKVQFLEFLDLISQWDYQEKSVEKNITLMVKEVLFMTGLLIIQAKWAKMDNGKDLITECKQELA